MPLLAIIALGGLFIGSQVDNAIQAKFGTVVKPTNNFPVIQIVVAVGGLAITYFILRKLTR